MTSKHQCEHFELRKWCDDDGFVRWLCTEPKCDFEIYEPPVETTAGDHGEPVPEAISFEQLLVDAARYRWLRKGNDYKHEGPMLVLCEQEHMDSDERPFFVLAEGALDAAVDDARGALNGGTDGV